MSSTVWKCLLVLCVASSGRWMASAQIPTAPCVGPDCLVDTTTTTSEAFTDETTLTTTPDASTTPDTSTNKRTVVFVRKQTNPGQDLFLRGGIEDTVRPNCTNDAETSPCAIAIEVNQIGNGTNVKFASYNAWRVNDTKLDWYGGQPYQGTFNGFPAAGTPMAWTTNDVTAPEYQPLNQWGPHYWMVDFQMDCSQTEDGWFEMKAFLTNAGAGWEVDIVHLPCTGTASDQTPPYSGTTNHFGRCGYLNVYSFNEGGCQIDNLD